MVAWKNRLPSEGGPQREGGESAGDGFAEERLRMVDHQLRARGIRDERVLKAFTEVPRHEFAPDALQDSAYDDSPLPIEFGQTISQPYIVALMAELARLKPDSRVLDIGTGCGYQAAILAKLCRKVYSIEVIEPLATAARDRLASLGYDNVVVRHGDGYAGWPEEQPFDAIIAAAAPPEIPATLIDQLAPGGQLILPVGTHRQKLLRIEKLADGTIQQHREAEVAFVPMKHASAS